jgi:signal transduction histidine kinase
MGRPAQFRLGQLTHLSCSAQSYYGRHYSMANCPVESDQHEPVAATDTESGRVNSEKPQFSYRLSVRFVVLVAAAASLLLAAWMWPRWQRSQNSVPARTFALDAVSSSEWKPFGGSWTIADGAVTSNSYERGAKLLAGSRYWSNYTVSADILYRGPAADMGVVIRTNDESRGVDAYNGYFVGLRSLDGTLVMGRASYSWLEVLPVSMPGGIGPFTWYRLRVTAYGCNVGASVTNLSTQQTAWIAFQERLCIKSGRFGLRTLNANAEWRNVRVEPATWNDYRDIEEHAAFVQHPIIVNGPPWWTPWHVGMLFTGTLAAAMLIQMAWFRFRHWKASTISRERERLAQDIHDTMAQGFAGIGYQIQGIRTGIMRAENLDARYIVDQLNVAYQLVRSCHEEASRTIAILGLSPPTIKSDLLGELSETARKTANNKVRTIAESSGDPVPMDPQLADALLHIGREAILNALNHGDPAILRISLSYTSRSVELAVSDNGTGFEYAREKEGFGLRDMQKRALSLRSVLQIRSAPGQGTEVRIRAGLRSVRLHHRLIAAFRRAFRHSSD